MHARGSDPRRSSREGIAFLPAAVQSDVITEILGSLTEAGVHLILHAC